MDPDRNLSPIGKGIAIASQLFGIALVMFVPAVAGGKLDEWLGTSFCSIGGLALGVIGGIYQLINLVKSLSPPPKRKG